MAERRAELAEGEAPVRVLLVDDDEDDFVITRAMLVEDSRRPYVLDWVDTFEAGLAALEAETHDVYLIDYRLGGRDGLQLLRTAQQRGLQRPIIMITGYGDRQVDLEAMRAGAADYLEKGQLAGPLLERSVRYAIERAEALDALRRNQQLLRHQALHDALTGLPNRTLFMTRLRRAMRRTQGDPTARFAVLFVDVDRFKVVNDSLGHMAGDDLLVAIAQRMAGRLGSASTVARLAGDEFAVLLEELDDYHDALTAAEQLQQTMERPFTLEQHEVFVTVSTGIVLSSAGHERAEDVLRDADIAMYRAKAEGRARYVVFDRTMHERALALLQLATELRRAVRDGEFRVRYQPIVTLRERRIVGFEALVRWAHPTRGLLPPDAFVPEAEDMGLMTTIDRWVLGEACRTASVLGAGQSRRAPFVSVNLAPGQPQQPDLAAYVGHTLETTKIAPSQLKLEVTERLLTDGSDARALLERLHALGVGLLLDDFGTGYAALGALTRLPIDMLKLDRSFVGGLQRDPARREIARAVIGLADGLGLDVIAEGIETAGQHETLRRDGYRYGQGLLFSAPVDAEAALDLLAADDGRLRGDGGRRDHAWRSEPAHVSDRDA